MRSRKKVNLIQESREGKCWDDNFAIGIEQTSDSGISRWEREGRKLKGFCYLQPSSFHGTNKTWWSMSAYWCKLRMLHTPGRPPACMHLWDPWLIWGLRNHKFGWPGTHSRNQFWGSFDFYSVVKAYNNLVI